MFKLDLEKAEEPEIKLQASDVLSKKQDSSRGWNSKISATTVQSSDESLLHTADYQILLVVSQWRRE